MRAWEFRLIGAVAMLLATACSASPAEPLAESEDVGEQQQPLNGCTSCWDFWGQYLSAFDIGDGLGCIFPIDAKSVYCTPSQGSAWKVIPSPGLNVGWTGVAPAGQQGFVPGGGGKAVAIDAPIRRQAAVFVLSKDNKVYVSTGDLTLANFYSGTNFNGFSLHVDNRDENGAALTLKDISMIALPNSFAPWRVLIALSSAGVIYVKRSIGGKWVWQKAANAGAPWNQIPAGTWLEISHGPVGAYLLSSTNKVFLAGGGKMDSQGVITWENRWLPGFQTLKIVHVGGPYAITQGSNEVCVDGMGCTEDGRRFWRFDGTVYRVAPSAVDRRVPTRSNDGFMPYQRIVDGSRFVNNVNHFSVFHAFSHVHNWVP